MAVPSRPSLRGAAIGFVRFGAGALVAFHVWLFAGRLRDDSLLEPGVAVRWLLAFALVGLAVLFRRQRLPLGSGRSGVVFWLLALLLHLGGTPLPFPDDPAAELLVALPLGVAAPLVLALAAARFAGRAPLATARTRARRAGWTPPRRVAILLAGLASHVVPRPPPAALA